MEAPTHQNPHAVIKYSDRSNLKDKDVLHLTVHSVEAKATETAAAGYSVSAVKRRNE